MTPAALPHLRNRQTRARLALEGALKSRCGGISKARRDYIKATADVLRASLKSRRVITPALANTPDLFSQAGA